MSVEQEVCRVIASHFGLEAGEVKPESNLTADLNGDSLDFTEIMMLLDEKLDLEIDIERLPPFVTVKDVADFLDQQLQEKKAGVASAANAAT